MNYVRFIVVIAVVMLSFQQLSAQSNYVMHTLKQGESLSALAKEYNTSVGNIMRLNGMHADSKLVYGSQIKIPSTQKQAAAKKVADTPAPPIVQTAAASANEITHIVAKGETLYSISKKYNISVDQIKAWNHLTNDNAKVGTLLIINESGSNKFSVTPVAKQQPETVTAQEVKEPPLENKTENNSAAVAENKPATVTDDVANNIQPAMQTVNNMNNPSIPEAVSDYSGSGFFASQFKERKKRKMQDIAGVSKTFKTASGWADGKYYILANDIEPGTIVKITAKNGNSVYAKVLWNMGDLKDNAGIDFRVSNATAAALHEDNPSFNVNVSF